MFFITYINTIKYMKLLFNNDILIKLFMFNEKIIKSTYENVHKINN
jgi:hypothetical protein